MLHSLLFPVFFINHLSLIRVYKLILLLYVSLCLLQKLFPSLILLFLLNEDFSHSLLEISELIAADRFVIFKACGVQLKEFA